MVFTRPYSGELDRSPPEDRRRGVIFQKSTKSARRLRRLVDQSQKVLLKISSTFPFDLFPDSLVIDENKVNVIRREFLGAERAHSILIENITSVTLNSGLFFASIEIVDSTNLRFPITYTLNLLNIKAALRARRLIQGLMEAKRNKVY